MTANFNDLLIEYEMRLQRNSYGKEWFLNETFISWYILAEGVPCESFSQNEIKSILVRNVRSYQANYRSDPDFSFILGWMLSVSFWYFEPLLREDDGARLLSSAYKNFPNNSLFKWALRDKLGLGQQEVEFLVADISLRYDQFFNYSALIKDYFLDIITTQI